MTDDRVEISFASIQFSLSRYSRFLNALAKDAAMPLWQSIDEAVVGVRHMHQLSTKSLEARRYQKRAFNGDAETEERQTSLKANTLRKLRVFADAQRWYSPTELDDLCRSIRKFSTAGAPPRWRMRSIKYAVGAVPGEEKPSWALACPGFFVDSIG